MTTHWLRGVLAAIGVALIASVATAQSAKSVPLLVERAAVVNGQLAVTVQNIGQRTIMAWGIESVARSAENKTQTLTTTTDGYESLARKIDDGVVLSPGARHTITIATALKDPAQIVNVSARPILAIFDDNTAVGDEGQIEFLFRQRSANQRLWKRVDELLAPAATGSDPVAVLHQANAALDDIDDQEILQGVALQAVRSQLSQAIQAGQLNEAAALRRIRDLLGEARTLRAAADARMRRAF